MTLAAPSYVCGSSSEPLWYLTVGDVLARAAESWPLQEALVVPHQDLRLTFQELDAQVSTLARALLAQGLVPGGQRGFSRTRAARVPGFRVDCGTAVLC